jgi:hypothetical protein
MEVTGMAIVMAIMVILPVTVIIITVMDIPIEIITMVMAGTIIDQRTATIVGGEKKVE